MKILACSDPINTATGMAQQMRMMLEEVPAEWTYVENGAVVSPHSFSAGPKPFETKNGKMMVHPGMNMKTRSYCLRTLADLAKKDDYDAMFLHDDPQYASVAYMTGWKMPVVYWFPYDSDTMFPSLAGTLDRFEKEHWKLCFMAKFPVKLAEMAGYKADFVYGIADNKAFCKMPEAGVESFKRKFSMTHGGCPMNRKILLFVGRNSPRKNIDGLISMAAALEKRRKDFILILRTSLQDPSPEAVDILSTISNYHMEKHVVVDNADYLMPGYTKSYLNMLYNAADLYVSAASGEGFGLPIAEAGLCGKTFVIPACTVSDEFMGDELRGFASPMNPGAFRRVRVSDLNGPPAIREMPLVDTEVMAENVDYLLGHEKKRDEMGEDFRKWVLANCSREVVAKKWSDILEDLNCGEVMAA